MNKFLTVFFAATASALMLQPNLASAAPLPTPVPITDYLGAWTAAAGLDWRFGPARAETVPRVVVDTARLQGMMAVEAATPAGLIGELAELRGRWP